jgi:predicted transcriptional regulator
MAQIGRPREFEEQRVTKAVRISRDLDQRLKQVARERGVSVNVIMNMALNDYLQRLLPLEDLLKTAS